MAYLAFLDACPISPADARAARRSRSLRLLCASICVEHCTV